ncbi:MAG TPA: LysM peptidoglycan-binding domain-containing protein [Rhodoglobus sp.]|nr:LysM peptidoglycan-binding domain-containing protein [Rhodoglobus sp.]
MSTATIGYGTGIIPASGRPAQPRLRLTKRGRGVLTTLAAAPLVVGAFLFALNGGGATASLQSSDVPFEYVTVEAGQSLWSVAESIAPQADPRDVIEQLKDLNRLGSTELLAGQQLAIPVEYR